MNISGTLHIYSGDRREFFFVFDDDIAQQLYLNDAFDLDDAATRRVYVSVGSSRLIHERTLSFSRKQTEIKVSLCSAGSKDGLGRLTELYDWFDSQGKRPEPFPVLGTLNQVMQAGQHVWELALTEAVEIVSPPGLRRRPRRQTRERRSFNHRREIVERDLLEASRPAEQLALNVAAADFDAPRFSCLWRDGFLDSELLEIREMGIIADIDVWDNLNQEVAKFIEVKAQKVMSARTRPSFYMSVGEWRSYNRARDEGIEYEIWLFQYKSATDFAQEPNKIRLIVYDELSPEWLSPNGHVVVPADNSGVRWKLNL